MSIKTTGYHGTTDTAANLIVSQNKFYVSKKDIEWLGFGTYFFAHKSYAEWWAKLQLEVPKNQGERPAILSVKLTYDENQLLDLDDPIQRNQVNELIQRLAKNTANVDNAPKANLSAIDQRKLWCLACNLYRRINKDIAITAYTFPVRTNPIGFSDTQRQFCVNNPAIISNIKKEAQ
ncbi:MAG TPA: hypothetical protein PLE84_06055 [Gemmiger qucibialis]|nr:hypothetical protein [Gemmiger qucibialis]